MIDNLLVNPDKDVWICAVMDACFLAFTLQNGSDDMKEKDNSIVPKRWEIINRTAKEFLYTISSIKSSGKPLNLESIRLTLLQTLPQKYIDKVDYILKQLLPIVNLDTDDQKYLSYAKKFILAILGQLHLDPKSSTVIRPGMVSLDGVSEAVIVSCWKCMGKNGSRYIIVFKIIYGPGCQSLFKIKLSDRAFKHFVNKIKGLHIKTYRIQAKFEPVDFIGCAIRCKVEDDKDAKLSESDMLVVKNLEILPATEVIAKYNRWVYFNRKRLINPCPLGKSIDCCNCAVTTKKCRYSWIHDHIAISKTCRQCGNIDIFDYNISDRMCLACSIKKFSKNNECLARPKLVLDNTEK